jgi:2-oxoglutarate ferredoxin oxidoreductase subunit delta
MVNDEERDAPEIPDDSPEYWARKSALEDKGVKRFTQTIYRDWCKGCGICIAFCPTKVFDRDETGKAVAARADACIGCRFCELHCPDFAITVTERYPDRRRKDK